MTTIASGDVENEGALSRDEAAEQLLSRWTQDAEKPSRDDEGAKPIRRSETERNEPDADDESDEDLILDEDEDQQEEQDETKADAPVEASDDALVKLTVGGEEIKIPVKDLKRLYGQEASLTRKSQEVAERRKFAEEEGARYVVATQKLIDKASERFKPYAQIDWAIAAKTLENDEYVALRQEATSAYQELQFLNNELDGVFAESQKARETASMEEAKVALEVLQRDIPNFSSQVYQDMGAFAVSKGIPQEAFASLTDPVALTIIYEAMAFKRAKERAATKRKSAPTTKRTMTTTRRTDTQVNREGDAMKRLQTSGKRDDAVAALMERWAADSE